MLHRPYLICFCVGWTRKNLYEEVLNNIGIQRQYWSDGQIYAFTMKSLIKGYFAKKDQRKITHKK